MHYGLPFSNRWHFFGDGALDLDLTLQQVEQALANVDDGDLFLESRHSEMLMFDDGRLKSSSYDHETGFGLRAIMGEADTFAHSGELSQSALERAVNTVRTVSSGYSGQMALSPAALANVPLYTDENPLDATPFEAKVALLQEIDAAARARDPRVRQVSASLASSWQAVQIIRAGGYRVADIRPLVRLNISVVVEKDGRMGIRL